GVTTKLLAAMEDCARRLGVERCTLDSTETARRFYERRGCRGVADAGAKHGMTNYPMAKDL
ncbi:MAG: GNAT family N-acetyltransferase, partial [Hyphomicrobiales bacterium]|nr:GNAT family N-acetyltransferase [Hyphomicrobiales bacterium]